MPDGTVTSRDITEVCGIVAKTLNRWYKLGLIPIPTIETNRDGMGRVSVWPDWVLPHCQAIQTLKKNGQALTDIAAEFDGDWQAISSWYCKKVVKPSYNFAAAMARMDADRRIWLWEEVMNAMKSHGLGIMERLQDPATTALVHKALDVAEELLEKGDTPILVVGPDEVLATTSDAIAAHLRPTGVFLLPLSHLMAE